MRRPRLLGPILLAPAALAASAGAAWWILKRWGYRVRTHERDVRRAPDPPFHPPSTPAGRPAVQAEAEGTGPRFHRTYAVTIRGAAQTPAELMNRIRADLKAFVPVELARFEKVRGEEHAFRVGDEYLIHITAPWDGPVRVLKTDETSFTFGTLEGHLEAGQIQFRAEPHTAFDGGLRFTIESWARSRDALVDLAYDDLELAKAAQQAMWTFFCMRVAEASGGEAVGVVEVITEREADPS